MFNSVFLSDRLPGQHCSSPSPATPIAPKAQFDDFSQLRPERGMASAIAERTRLSVMPPPSPIWMSVFVIKCKRARQQAKRNEIPRNRLHTALRQLADGPGRGVAASQVAQHLVEGAWDDTELALLCWPQRVAEKCLDDPVLANTLRLNLPPKRTKSAVTRWMNELAAAGCPSVADDLLATLASDDAFDRVVAALEGGRRDHAPLALALWPDRVIDRCLENVELAALHDLRRFFWMEEQDGWRRRRESAVEVVQEIERRK